MGNVVPIAVRRTVGRRARTREHLLEREVDKLIQGARRNRYGLRDSTLILILFSHGLRVSEGLQARWQQFDLEQGVFHVRRLKGSLSGDHRLRGVEIRALRRLRKEGPVSPEFVFASERGGRLGPRAVQLMLDRVSMRAGLGELHIHPHCFRHSCGYYLAERGADLRLIQQYLGHKNIAHTVRYVQLSPRHFHGLFDD